LVFKAGVLRLRMDANHLDASFRRFVRGETQFTTQPL
jgi:hypothetical protein